MTGQGDQKIPLERMKMRDLVGHAIQVRYDGVVALPTGEYDEIEANKVYSMNRDGLYSVAGLMVTNVEIGVA